MHGDAQLANSLTKGNEPGQLGMYYSSGHRWKLGYDAKYQSARKRRAAGIPPFENVPPGVLHHGSSDLPGERVHIPTGAVSHPNGTPEYEAASDYGSANEC